MRSELLTPDNPHLSRLTNGSSEDPDSPPSEARTTSPEDQLSRVSVPFFASTCKLATSDPIPNEVAALVQASVADNTRRAYRSDLDHFAAWGGTLPGEPALVASYLAAHSASLSVATLVRRVATISKAHQAQGLANPCRSEIVRATLRGVKRTRGTAQREAKPLLREDLFRVLDFMGEGVKDARDRVGRRKAAELNQAGLVRMERERKFPSLSRIASRKRCASPSRSKPTTRSSA